jgi:hypothetical protein
MHYSIRDCWDREAPEERSNLQVKLGCKTEFVALRRWRTWTCARLFNSKLVMTCATIGPPIAGIVFGIVLSADVTVAAAWPGVSDSEPSRLGSADDYVRSGPAFPTTYEDPLMGIEVNNGWGELKSGQRLSGVEILRVTPDGPGAAAGLQSQRAAVQTALTIALTVGAIFFPPAILGLIEVQQSGLGESYDLIMAVDGQRTRVMSMTSGARSARPRPAGLCILRSSAGVSAIRFA